MATTINAENAKPIRQAMSVEVEMQVSENVSITSYNVYTPYKLADRGFIMPSIRLRKLADLQDDGFPLDGQHSLFVDMPVSTTNGKTAVQGTVGENLRIWVSSSGSGAISSLTIKTINCIQITCNGTTIDATGLDVLYVGGLTATLTFVPKDENSRVIVEYVEPGVKLMITNETLIRCGVNLRSNLEPDNPSWEASDIEVQAYYPYDISDSLAHVQDDWPITYRAGYPGDMSPLRNFYLSEPAIMDENVLTLRGVDSTPKLEKYVLREGDFKNLRDTEISPFQAIYLDTAIRGHLQDAGIQIYDDTRPGPSFETGDYYVLPSMTLRDCVQGIMNLTADLPEGYRISYVDAGIPTLKNHDRSTDRWTVDESMLSEVKRIVPRKIREIRNTNGKYKFDETFTKSTNEGWVTQEAVEQNSIVEYSFDAFSAESFVYLRSSTSEDYQRSFIEWTPSHIVFKAERTAEYAYLMNYTLKASGGSNSYISSDRLPGVVLEMEPFVYGKCHDPETGVNMLSPKNLLLRNTRTTSFLFRGDPRWQPRDFLTINLRGGTTRKTRIASIELEHEGGGTQARVTCQDTNLY